MYYISLVSWFCLMFQFLIIARNVLFRCCFRFSFTFKAKQRRRKSFCDTEFSWSFSSLISRYFYQLVACAWYALERIYFLMVLSPFRWLKSVRNPFFCSSHGSTWSDFPPLLFLLRVLVISHCMSHWYIIKKSELWFIEKKKSVGNRASL